MGKLKEGKSQTWGWSECSRAAQTELEYCLKQLDIFTFFTERDNLLTKKDMRPCRTYMPTVHEHRGKGEITCRYYGLPAAEGGCEYQQDMEDAEDEGNIVVFNRMKKKLANMCPISAREELATVLNEVLVQEDEAEKRWAKMSSREKKNILVQTGCYDGEYDEELGDIEEYEYYKDDEEF